MMTRDQEKAMWARWAGKNAYKLQYRHQLRTINKQHGPSFREAVGQVLYTRKAKHWAKGTGRSKKQIKQMTRGTLASQAGAVKILERTTGRGKRRERVPLVGKAQINAIERWLGSPNPIKINKLFMDEPTRQALAKYRQEWHLWPIRPRRRLSLEEQYTLHRFGESLITQEKTRKKVKGALGKIVKRRKGSAATKS